MYIFPKAFPSLVDQETVRQRMEYKFTIECEGVFCIFREVNPWKLENSCVEMDRSINHIA